MGLYFKDLKVPTDCLSCNMRDIEYGGDCCLMPADHFDTYEWQYGCCPIKALMKLCSGIVVPPHGDLIDRSKYEHPGDLKWEPVIIPASE